jgi:hypothetical protein
VFTGVLHWSLFWARSIQSIPSHPISLRSILILSKILYAFFLSPISALQFLRIKFHMYLLSLICVIQFPPFLFSSISLSDTVTRKRDKWPEEMDKWLEEGAEFEKQVGTLLLGGRWWLFRENIFDGQKKVGWGVDRRKS